MDTRIPLGVQPIDFAGAMQNGLQAGTMARQAAQQNALAQLYQRQGPQIMAGNPQALNALAQMDPMAAQQAQQGQLGIQQTQMQMQEIRDRAKAAVAEHAAKVNADQLAAEAAQTETMLRGAAPLYMAAKQGDPQAMGRLLSYLNAHGIQATQDNVETILYASSGALEGMKTYADMNKPAGPAWKPATPEQAAQYGAAAGQIDTTTGKFDPINPPSNGVTIRNPDGTVTQIGGPSGGGKPLTEAEGKNAGFLIRMRDAQDVLNKFETQGTDLGASLLSMDPTGLSNYAQSPEFQLFDQAKRDFVNAILRRESGAAISPSEFENAQRQYFPVPGDSPEVIAQKRKNRDNAIAGVTVGAGSGTQNPLVSATGETATDFKSMDLTAMTKVDVMKLNESQLAEFMARMQELHQ